jgi:hypothetical protein
VVFGAGAPHKALPQNTFYSRPRLARVLLTEHEIIAVLTGAVGHFRLLWEKISE